MALWQPLEPRFDRAVLQQLPLAGNSWGAAESMSARCAPQVRCALWAVGAVFSWPGLALHRHVQHEQSSRQQLDAAGRPAHELRQGSNMGIQAASACSVANQASMAFNGSVCGAHTCHVKAIYSLIHYYIRRFSAGAGAADAWLRARPRRLHGHHGGSAGS